MLRYMWALLAFDSLVWLRFCWFSSNCPLCQEWKSLFFYNVHKKRRESERERILRKVVVWEGSGGGGEGNGNGIGIYFLNVILAPDEYITSLMRYSCLNVLTSIRRHRRYPWMSSNTVEWRLIANDMTESESFCNCISNIKFLMIIMRLSNSMLDLYPCLSILTGRIQQIENH